MFEYELHRLRSADLIREAQAYRLAREATSTRRAARRAAGARSAHGDTDERAHSDRPRRHRFARAV
ncbi:hypothetical protein ACWD4F_13650 [Streptomyces aureus]|uniref:hypothetical protein n=1 Tax=Streptomyces aureus TaxID=193461 RepID=UPI00055F2D69|nr:hypothetical protein [Streptomyces aureus]